MVMALFFRRFFGALVLDAAAFENIEADPHAAIQSAIVILVACFAGGLAAMGLGVTGPSGFAIGAIIVLGAWLVWVGLIATVGTIMLAEPQTKSGVSELLRTLAFAASPAVFLSFAAMKAAAPFVLALVAFWIIAAAVVAVRQALDYHGTGRAIAVCAISLAASFGVMAAIAFAFTRTVN